MLPKFRSIYAVVPLLLCIPWIAMMFTDEVHWTMGDFVLMAVMLSLLVSILDNIWRMDKSVRLKFLMFGLAVSGFVLIWAQLAIGIF